MERSNLQHLPLSDKEENGITECFTGYMFNISLTALLIPSAILTVQMSPKWNDDGVLSVLTRATLQKDVVGVM